MPRFHFHILDGTELFDKEGTELRSIDAAKAEIVQLAGAVLSGASAHKIWDHGTWKIVVKDGPSIDAGRTYFSMIVSAIDHR